MNLDDILRMAREAGLFTHREVQPEIIHFAALVSAAEREACAQICDSYAKADHANYADSCAEEIRARGDDDK